jgi:hypothetical protein
MHIRGGRMVRQVLRGGHGQAGHFWHLGSQLLAGYQQRLAQHLMHILVMCCRLLRVSRDRW